jgi:predicted ribosome quality control (RQC) complex YloA/Tae2 family protein
MDIAVLQHIARELNERLPGGFINKIHQPLPREIVLRVRSVGVENKLMLSADPLLGRAHLAELRIPNPPRPLRFCAFLRAHFQGSRVVEVTAAEDDRVLTITATRGPADQKTVRNLVLELLGRDSNIILVDAESGVIMDCLHHIPEKEGGTRIVTPGAKYGPPPARELGASPMLKTDIGLVSPGITILPNGRKAITLSAGPRDEAFSTVNEAADALYGEKLNAVLLESYRREIAAPLRTRIKSLERRLVKIDDDLRRHRELAKRQEEGELLKPNLARIKKGMDRIEVQDWSTGEKRVIKLDPAQDAVANMNAIFKKAAKGKRGETAAQERLRITLEEKAALEDLLYFVQAATSVSDLERIESEMKEPRESRQTRERQPRLGRGAGMFLVFTAPGGCRVLVGRSGMGNDHILRHKAAKGDLWFHVKDMPGAHVLLQKGGASLALHEDKEFAAGLAVHFSRARGKGKAEVMVADAGDVSRPKGALPGQVTVRKFTTLVSEGMKSEPSGLG